MKTKIKEFLLLNLGAVMDAAGFYFFLAPNEIAAGGITGLSLIINTFFPGIPLGIIVLIFSIILLTIGFLLIGSTFGVKTIYCSITIPLLIWAFEYFIPLAAPLTNDTLIQLFFGVFISGIGLAILFNQNASSGGTDIVARILHKFYRIDIGKGLLMIDFLITIGAAFVFGLEKGMYALLGVILYGFVIDYAVEGLTISKNVTIITAEPDLVAKFIVEELDRGATVYKARGGFTDQEREVIVTIVKRLEFIKLRNYIQKTDENAFISVQDTHEVLGEGFLPIDR
ncbi:MAG TPA: YitT family protein [Syntrophomonadaceae bacterium]|nr:YitT family protein [Syntrophomonadaceae bacterium]